MARRVVSVLIALVMFHLTLASADFFCATHGVLADSSSDGGDAHAHHTAAASEPAPSGDDCETPVRVECCDALASCALNADIRDAGLDARDAVNDGVMASIDDRARSVISSPDPPPPRA